MFGNEKITSYEKDEIFGFVREKERVKESRGKKRMTERKKKSGVYKYKKETEKKSRDK